MDSPESSDNSLEDIEKESEVILKEEVDYQLTNLGIDFIPQKDVTKRNFREQWKYGKEFIGDYLNHTVLIRTVKRSFREKRIEFYRILQEISSYLPYMKKANYLFLGVMKSDTKLYLLFNFTLENNLLQLSPSLDEKNKLEIIRNLCIILNELHQKNIRINYLRPEQIIVHADNKITLITDFFSESFFGPRNSVLYMAPDIFEIDVSRNCFPFEEDVKPISISYKSDIWTLGLIISELLSDVRAYSNLRKKPNEQLIVRRLSQKMDFPIPENLKPEYKDLVEKATSITPEDRPEAWEIIETIDNLLLNFK